MNLKPKYVKMIQEDISFHYRICQSTGKSWSTISRWCSQNSENLTLESVQQTIREYLNLSKTTSLVVEQKNLTQV